MSLIFAAVVIVLGLAGAVTAAVAVPLLLGVVMYDVAEARRGRVYDVTDAHIRIAVERGVARAFVILGGAFWTIAAFAGLSQSGAGSATLMAALWPMAACAATLIIGWYFERVCAALLALGSIAVIAWGVIFGFEFGVWVIMTFVLIGPMVTAAILFWAARRDQEAFEQATATRPQLSLVFAARSSLATEPARA